MSVLPVTTRRLREFGLGAGGILLVLAIVFRWSDRMKFIHHEVFHDLTLAHRE